ncbi:MAG: hypothetical protein PF961_02565 [Planctomycetota bacterium]|jgi:hypothetical protein|nr:hypothetical protein [Planctomycetota bacterium]
MALEERKVLMLSPVLGVVFALWLGAALLRWVAGFWVLTAVLLSFPASALVTRPLSVGAVTGYQAGLILFALAAAALPVLAWRSRDLLRNAHPFLTVHAALVGSLIVWSALGVAVAPLLFADLLVLAPTRTDSTALTRLADVQERWGHWRQLTVMLLGYLSLVLLIAQSGASRQWSQHSVLVLALFIVGGGLLHWLLLVCGLPLPEFIHNHPVYYQGADQELVPGLRRLSGFFPEPSNLARALVGVYAYAVAAALRSERRWPWVLLALVALSVGVRSTSFTFVVAAPVAGGAALVLSLRVALVRRIAMAFGIAVGTAVCLQFLEWIFLSGLLETGLDGGLVGQKKGSFSLHDRLAGDWRSIVLVWESWFLGVGAGGHRSFSLVPNQLATLGLPGCLVLGALWLQVVRRGWPGEQVYSESKSMPHRAVSAAAGAFFIGQLVASCASDPDLVRFELWFPLGVWLGCTLAPVISPNVNTA